MAQERKSLLASYARIQAPWIKVEIGGYSFGVFDRATKSLYGGDGVAKYYNVQYPSYIRTLTITKINGQVNQYTLQLDYPVRPKDDPNFFEKIFSRVSSTRKIIFSYGDSATPAYVFKQEEAIITGVSQSFNLEGSSISYTVNAVSTAIVGMTGSFTFVNTGLKKPSDEIKAVFNNSRYGLQKIFTGMSRANLDQLVAGDDKAVELDTKTNISPLDYILYLAGCMIPAASTTGNLSKDIYILTVHDETVFDALYTDAKTLQGPYFKVTRTSTAIEKADAYNVDIGYNTATLVSNFSIKQQENYSIYYDYNMELAPESYARRLDNNGQWEDVYAPMYTSGNNQYKTRTEDITWFTKLTNYPISASLTVHGLLRPATLMQYLRLNVIFPGGNQHISSGLYIVTKQVDTIGESGYKTTLDLTRIAG